MGASIVDDANQPITDFEAHIKKMKGFHQRYMCSNKVIRLWVNMVRQMDIDMIVPQHGRPMKGAAVAEFIDWIDGLECGVDHFTQDNYRIPA
jgi:flavorubredoxin